MNQTPLYFLWDYNDVDRAFWGEHLEAWVPRRIYDVHTHMTNPAHRLETMTEEMRRQIWVNEVSEPIGAEDAERCMRTVFPGRQVKCLAMGSPSLAFDLEATNEYVRTESLKRGWHCLALLRPQWTGHRVAQELAKPGVIGVKPYYSLLSYSPNTRDAHLGASIFDFLPHHALEALNERGAWVTLHVPKAERLPHPQNIREVREIRKLYPRIVLVLAHLGRCYTEPHAREALPQVADDPELYFDTSAVMNPAVHRIALEHIGPERLLYGTDNPVFYMRGRRQWQGRTYVNRTNRDFYFNKEREAPEVEAGYTLCMYEDLRAIRDVCAEFGVSPQQVDAIFHDNAARLIQQVPEAKAGA